MKIFISYSRREAEWVQNLHAKLNNFPEHDVWMDKNLVGGVDWWNTILDNIEQADIVLYIMSPTSIESTDPRLHGLRDYIPFGWSEERWQQQLQKEAAKRSEATT